MENFLDKVHEATHTLVQFVKETGASGLHGTSGTAQLLALRDMIQKWADGAESMRLAVKAVPGGRAGGWATIRNELSTFVEAVNSGMSVATRK